MTKRALQMDPFLLERLEVRLHQALRRNSETHHRLSRRRRLYWCHQIDRLSALLGITWHPLSVFVLRHWTGDGAVAVQLSGGGIQCGYVDTPYFPLYTTSSIKLPPSKYVRRWAYLQEQP